MKAAWYVTDAAVRDWLRVFRQPDSDEAYDQAEEAILDLIPAASLKATDSLGRQMWRTGRPQQVRFVVDTRKLMRQDGRDLPRLIWLGRGKPPGWAWDPGAE